MSFRSPACWRSRNHRDRRRVRFVSGMQRLAAARLSAASRRAWAANNPDRRLFNRCRLRAQVRCSAKSRFEDQFPARVLAHQQLGGLKGVGQREGPGNGDDESPLAG
jgi:hypothetical protein